jgi:hypothetical protein
MLNLCFTKLRKSVIIFMLRLLYFREKSLRYLLDRAGMLQVRSGRGEADNPIACHKSNSGLSTHRQPHTKLSRFSDDNLTTHHLILYFKRHGRI